MILISLGEYEYGIAHSRSKNELQLWLQAFVQRAEVFCRDMATLPHCASVRSSFASMPLLSRDQHFDLVDDIRRLEW